MPPSKRERRENLIADACILLSEGADPELLYSLIDAAIGLHGAVKQEEEL